MKTLLILPVLAMAAASSGCTVTSQTVAADVQQFCAAYGAAAPAVQALISADGTIVGISSSAQTKLAAGEQLVSINCAALTVLTAKTPATALAPEDVLRAAKISPEIVARIAKHYGS